MQSAISKTRNNGNGLNAIITFYCRVQDPNPASGRIFICPPSPLWWFRVLKSLGVVGESQPPSSSNICWLRSKISAFPTIERPIPLQKHISARRDTQMLSSPLLEATLNILGGREDMEIHPSRKYAEICAGMPMKVQRSFTRRPRQASRAWKFQLNEAIE